MDLEVYVKFLVALAAVLALIAGLAWVARRLGLAGRLPSAAGKSARISVVEVRALDARRKLVLLRRDACEHLVLLGPNQDLLVESGIPMPPRFEAPPAEAAPAAPALRAPERRQ